MSSEQTVTEREARLRERAAFVAGVTYKDAIGLYPPSMAELNRRYPLPTVTRPRVVRDPMGSGIFEWCVETMDSTGKPTVVWRWQGTGAWRRGLSGIYATSERVALWADLLANPTETVEE